MERISLKYKYLPTLKIVNLRNSCSTTSPVALPVFEQKSSQVVWSCISEHAQKDFSPNRNEQLSSYSITELKHKEKPGMFLPGTTPRLVLNYSNCRHEWKGFPSLTFPATPLHNSCLDPRKKPRYNKHPEYSNLLHASEEDHSFLPKTQLSSGRSTTEVQIFLSENSYHSSVTGEHWNYQLKDPISDTQFSSPPNCVDSPVQS